MCVLNEWVGNDEMEVGSKETKKESDENGRTEWEGREWRWARHRHEHELAGFQGWAWVGVGVCEGGKKERQGQDGETCLVSSPAQIPSFASLLPRRPFLLPTAPCRSKMC